MPELRNFIIDDRTDLILHLQYIIAVIINNHNVKPKDDNTDVLIFDRYL